jgi:hypothetical protein
MQGTDSDNSQIQQEGTPETQAQDTVSNDQKVAEAPSFPAYNAEKGAASPIIDKKPITEGMVKRALYEKIKNYPGGIEGLWEDICPQFKHKNQHNPNGIKGTESGRKMHHSAFLKQVIRFKNADEFTNERITFTVKNSSLLLLNVFELLGIKSMDDLLRKSFQKEDIDTINRETNINSRKIFRKLSKMYDILITFDERKSRFPIQKVCYDLEDIIIKLHGLINDKVDPQSILVNNFFDGMIQNISEQSRFAFMSYNVIKKYREYFSRDVLLHKYSDFIISSKYTIYGRDIKLFYLSPLYILYFFIIVNKYFILGLGNSKKNKRNGETIPLFSDYNIKIKKKKDDKDDSENLLGKKNIDEIIYILNNDIYKCLKNILSLANNVNLNISKADYDEYCTIMKDIIELFYSLYENKTTVKPDWNYFFSKYTKNLNEIYSLLSLGHGIKFIPVQKDIEILIASKIRIESIYDELTRELKFING